MVRQRPLEPPSEGSNPSAPAFCFDVWEEGEIMPNNQNDFSKMACIILAAGLGTRMKSNQSKVFFPFLGKALVEYVLEKAESLSPGKIILVVSPKDYKIALEKYGKRVVIAIQKEPLGTGDAVKAGINLASEFPHCMILCGDTPLLETNTILSFCQEYYKQKASCGFISAVLDEPKMYGRVIRCKDQSFRKIVEFKDANETERAIKEVNSGIYLFQTDQLIHSLKILNTNNAAREFYFTDTLVEFKKNKETVMIWPIIGEDEIFGINNKLDLSKALKIALKKIKHHLMLEEGVIMTDPDSVYIGPEVKIGKDTIVLPFCYLDGKISIGENSQIGPYVCMRGIDSPIQIGDDCFVGPFSSIRGGSVLEEGSHMGTFVELKKTRLGKHSKAMHLSYLGDTEIGKKANIGAGTITCNYDGFTKHKTIIEDDVFIGSDTIIVAPLKICKGSYTAAGSVITEDIPPDSLGIGRARQLNKEGWCKKMRESKAKKE